MATITSLMFRMNSTYNGDAMRQARSDISRLDGSMNALTKSSNALKPGMKDLVSTVLALGPALIPIAGGLLGIGAAAGSAMVGAGAAVGIFGIAMKGAIKATVGQGSAVALTASKLQTAQNALDNTAKGTKAYTKAVEKVTLAERAHEKALKDLPPVQEAFGRAYDNAKVAIIDFNNENAKFTLKPATTMLEAFMAALPKLGSLIGAISPEIQRVANLTKKWVTDGGLDRFLTFVKTYGIPALHGFVDAIRYLFGALGIGMRDTAPLGAAFTTWLINVMKAFKGWAEGGGFQRFLAWLAANKGALLGVAKDLGTSLANIGKAAGGMSQNAFIVLGTLLKVLASFPPGLLQAMAYGFIIWSTALKLYAAWAFISAVATTAMTMAASPMLLLMVGAALTIGAVILAIIALGVGLFFLVKYWDTVWSAIKTAWFATWNAIKTSALAVWDFLTHGWGQLLLAFMGPIGLLIFLAKHWSEIWDGIKVAAFVVWDALKLAWSAFSGWMITAWNATWDFLAGKFNAVIQPIRDMWTKVWPELQLSAMNIWNSLQAAWSAVWGFFTTVWNAFWSVFGGQFRDGWTAISAVATLAWAVLSGAWNILWTTITGIAQVAWSVISGAFQIFLSVIIGAAQIAWSVITGAWQVLWSVVSGIFGVFTSVFGAIFGGFWNVIVAIASAIWNTIAAAWSALWSVITALFLVFTAIFTGHWSLAWNAVKDAAAAVWNVITTAWQGFLGVITAVYTAFAGVFTALWTSLWAMIQSIATTAWNALRTVFTTFLAACQAVWTTVWTAVQTVFSTITAAIMAVFNAWVAAFKAAVDAFLNAVKAVWNAAWAAIQAAFSTVTAAVTGTATSFWATIQGIFSAGSTWLLHTFWDPVAALFTKTIPDAFSKGASALGAAWDKVRDLVRKPIQAVVDVVYNNGIVKLWNIVAGAFGAPTLSNFTLPQFKEGGPTGNGSQDGFLAKVHPGEHVWTRQEVAGAGGHEAVAKLRSQAMGGAKVRLYGKKDFDDGGGIFGTGIGPNVGPDLVPDGIIGNALNALKSLALGAISGPFGAAVDGVAKLGKEAVKAAVPGSGSMMESLGTGMIDKIATTIKDWVKGHDIAPDVGGGDSAAGLAWARTQVGKPYQWGGNGNPSWDCSGFMSAIESVIRGEKPHRRWATGAFSGGTAPPGWKLSAKSPFTIGITNAGVGHTAGTLNGVNVESSGGAGVRVGSGARGASDGMFTAKYGFLPAVESGATSGAAQATAKAMLSTYGWAASQWPSLQKLWQGESGWNYKAVNPSSGALGIPQALPGSKMASAGADYKTNATTQIKWGEGYIKSVYGSPSAAYSKWLGRSPHWYGRGTQSAAPGWNVVGDKGIELLHTRGGETIQPLDALEARGGGNTITIPVSIDARGATPAAVDKLFSELPDRLRMALEQGTGRRN